MGNENSWKPEKILRWPELLNSSLSAAIVMIAISAFIFGAFQSTAISVCFYFLERVFEMQPAYGVSVSALVVALLIFVIAYYLIAKNPEAESQWRSMKDSVLEVSPRNAPFLIVYVLSGFVGAAAIVSVYWLIFGRASELILASAIFIVFTSRLFLVAVPSIAQRIKPNGAVGR